MKFLLSVSVDANLSDVTDLASDLLGTLENYTFSENASVNISKEDI